MKCAKISPYLNTVGEPMSTVFLCEVWKCEQNFSDPYIQKFDVVQNQDWTRNS